MRKLSHLSLLIGSVLMLVLMVGCAVDTAADQARHDAFYAPAGPVVEFVKNHPEQAQTYSDWDRSWQKDIDARKTAGWFGAAK